MTNKIKSPARGWSALGGKLFNWSLVFLWAVIIFYFSSIPQLRTNLGFWDFILRKLAHMLEFGVLATLLFRSFRSYKIKLGLNLLISGSLSLLYAAFDEIHQSFVFGRSAAAGDVLIDLVGILIVLGLVRMYKIGYSRNKLLNG